MRERSAGHFAFVFTMLITAAWPVGADDWPQFRGPASQGISAETGVPIAWSPTSQVRWKTPLAGPGHSSPIVWGDRIFLTAYRPDSTRIGDALRSLAGRLAMGVAVQGELLVMSIDRLTGRILWERDVPVSRIEKIHPTNSPASPTPATDGTHVYVYFGSYGLLCFDFDGQLIWERRLGPYPNEWGSASSPVLYGDLLLLNVDSDAEDFLLAVDKRSGKTIWQTKRSDVARSWPTPIVWSTPAGDEIVVSGSGRLVGYDAKTGGERWHVNGLTRWVAPTPVVAHGLLYAAANGPGGNVILAVRPGGRGDVTSSHVLWRYGRGAPYVPSPIVVGDRLFTVRNGGVMTCVDAKTGQFLWQGRLPGRGDYYASPVAAEGRIYAISEDGVVTVVAAKPSFEVEATNDMGERTLASPAISGGMIFIRTDENLYAIGR